MTLTNRQKTRQRIPFFFFALLRLPLPHEGGSLDFLEDLLPHLRRLLHLPLAVDLLLAGRTYTLSEAGGAEGEEPEEETVTEALQKTEESMSPEGVVEGFPRPLRHPPPG